MLEWTQPLCVAETARRRGGDLEGFHEKQAADDFPRALGDFSPGVRAPWRGRIRYRQKGHLESSCNGLDLVQPPLLFEVRCERRERRRRALGGRDEQSVGHGQTWLE